MVGSLGLATASIIIKGSERKPSLADFSLWWCPPVFKERINFRFITFQGVGREQERKWISEVKSDLEIERPRIEEILVPVGSLKKAVLEEHLHSQIEAND